MSAVHDHEHHDEYRPSEISLRVKAIESLLVEKKLLDPVCRQTRRCVWEQDRPA